MILDIFCAFCDRESVYSTVVLTLRTNYRQDLARESVRSNSAGLTCLLTILSRVNVGVYLYAIVSMSTSAYRSKSWRKFSEFVTTIFPPLALF